MSRWVTGRFVSSIALAIAVLGGAYIYTNPDQAGDLIQRVQSWATLTPTMPSIGAADAVLFVAMSCGLVSMIFLLTRGKRLLRGPAKIKMVR